jgi:hypothetical protein
VEIRANGRNLATELKAAIAGRPVYVHIDCDVLDPGIVPTDYRVPHGLSLDDLSTAATIIAKHEVVGIEIGEFESPANDTSTTGDIDDPGDLLDALHPLLRHPDQERTVGRDATVRLAHRRPTGACGSDSSSTAASPSESSSAGGPPSGAVPSSSEQSAEVKALIAEVQDKFQQATYEDGETGESLPYNIYLPDDYDASKSYPMVLYIADSSLVGQDVTAPLSQYGALIWASDAEQAKHESIVVVPEYPSVIIDDHDSYTTTDYVDMTARLVAAVQEEYSVDPDRVYGTGQSMGCMTVMYLAASTPICSPPSSSSPANGT